MNFGMYGIKSYQKFSGNEAANFGEYDSLCSMASDKNIRYGLIGLFAVLLIGLLIRGRK